MIRTLDGSFLTEVANHPDVRHWLGGVGALDLRPIVADPLNYALQGEKGGFILHRLEAARYEAHSIFLPKAREAPGLALDGFRWLFTHTDCLEIVTKVPDANKAANGLARWCGFTELFRREAAWDGAGCSYRSLTLDRWIARDSTLKAHGHSFHALLDAAKKETGSKLQPHPDDAAHEKVVGAAVLMMRAANPRKAVWAYNRWASFAGYVPIRLVSETPLLVDVVDAVVNASEVVLIR